MAKEKPKLVPTLGVKKPIAGGEVTGKVEKKGAGKGGKGGKGDKGNKGKGKGKGKGEKKTKTGK